MLIWCAWIRCGGSGRAKSLDQQKRIMGALTYTQGTTLDRVPHLPVSPRAQTLPILHRRSPSSHIQSQSVSLMLCEMRVSTYPRIFFSGFASCANSDGSSP